MAWISIVIKKKKKKKVDMPNQEKVQKRRKTFELTNKK